MMKNTETTAVQDVNDIKTFQHDTSRFGRKFSIVLYAIPSADKYYQQREH